MTADSCNFDEEPLGYMLPYLWLLQDLGSLEPQLYSSEGTRLSDQTQGGAG